MQFVLYFGNKIDLKDKRVIAYDEGKTFAQKYGVKFIETSAKSAEGVSEAFYSVAKEIYDNENNITIDDIVIEKDKKKKKDNKEKKT
jgi:GTPase SAR1 family protein